MPTSGLLQMPDYRKLGGSVLGFRFRYRKYIESAY